MEQFNALPFPQKVAALVVAMAVVAGLFYYAMIIPIDEQVANNEQQRLVVQGEVDKLREELKDNKDRDIVGESEKLNAERIAFEEMLPKKEELPKFITGLSEIAKNAGLKLKSFSKGQPNEQDFYLEIPITMEVLGTYRELIGFLRTISEKDRRVVNIRNLTIDRTKLNVTKILARYRERHQIEQAGAQSHFKQKNWVPGQKRIIVAPKAATSPLHKLMELVKAYEEAIAGGVPLEAKFTAYVFAYTGKKAGKEAKQQNENRVKSRQDRRRKNVIVLEEVKPQ